MPAEITHPEHLPTRLSRIRGLCLGLALGDALGNATADERDGSGPLVAGVATELAAWSIEGTQRNYVRYGILHADLVEVGLYGYQRWFEQRGYPEPRLKTWVPRFLAGFADGSRPWPNGWLWEDPAMGTGRGKSPTTIAALQQGRPVRSAGCQALIRVLPVAAFTQLERPVGASGYSELLGAGDSPYAAYVEMWARNLALLTHDDGESQRLSGLGVRLVAAMLQRSRLTLDDRVRQAVEEPHLVREPMADASRRDLVSVLEAPRADLSVLRGLAPDTSARSALLGGLYAAMSFPDVWDVGRALDFALRAPDPDSVAAVTGAVLGALFGYEALPTSLLPRLTHGWTMDRLAIDLDTSLSGFQAPASWKEGWPSDRPDPDVWWDSKYPGA
ncbi:ADP-ribosylglycohydrolase family protein [Nocardioides yefusunii]|uniref:ADP-ribosylglycohydrolase family protein n=1 Tax=Nocardioides yefusunii TaxID=2500546 RepID=A0ABW1R1R9_9ACTN|nr:ADP-ribosylglycohydrolase family protein [Nocardioides yefusunii]